MKINVLKLISMNGLIKKVFGGFLRLNTGILRVVFFSKKIRNLTIFFAGGLFFYRKRGKLKSIFHNSNFLIAAVHGILLSLIAVIYRLIVLLNWIIQQAR
jgi:hypothetical protein